MLISVGISRKRVTGSKALGMLSFSRFYKTFCKVDVSILIPMSNLRGFWLFHILRMAVLGGALSLLIVVLMSSSFFSFSSLFLMTDRVEHLFICLLAIWVFSSVKCLFKSF